jgi:hypothetical protein
MPAFVKKQGNLSAPEHVIKCTGNGPACYNRYDWTSTFNSSDELPYPAICKEKKQ